MVRYRYVTNHMIPLEKDASAGEAHQRAVLQTFPSVGGRSRFARFGLYVCIPTTSSTLCGVAFRIVSTDIFERKPWSISSVD